jgi:transcriptional regulator with XRE-family HTH domain
MADSSQLAGTGQCPEAAETLLAERLRALREAADITQGELAERMTRLGFSMHQTAVAKVERGQRPVRLNEVAAFAAALRVPVTDLLTVTDSTPEAEERWSDLLAVTSQRLELTQRNEGIRAQLAVLGEQQAQIVRRLEEIEQREAEARKRWQAASAGEDTQTSAPRRHPPVSIATAKELYAIARTCAYPGCDRPLYRINADGSRTLNSRIAHICARQEGGPRWNPEMSQEENRSVDNLILLCIEHADEIDQPGRASLYPTEVLLGWKREQLARFDDHTDGWEITPSEARKVIQESASLQLSMEAGVINLGGIGGNAPSSGGGGGAAIGKGAKGGKGGPGGPIRINLRGMPGSAPGAGGGGAGFIDPDSPLFWNGEGMPTFGESSYLGVDGNDGGDSTFGPDDDGRMLRARGGKGARVGTGIRSKSARLTISALMLANHVEFQGNFGYVTGTGFTFYNVLNLNDTLIFSGMAVLECGGVQVGEYALTLEVLDPQNKVASTVRLVFAVTKAGDILRILFKFSLLVTVSKFGMWTIVARHEDKELARLPVVVKQGAP